MDRYEHRLVGPHGMLLLFALLLGPASSLPASNRVLPQPSAASVTQSAIPAEFRGSDEPWGPLHDPAPDTPPRMEPLSPPQAGDRVNASALGASTARQSRHWTMEEPTPTPPTTAATITTTRDYSGLYISPPIMVLDGISHGERDNTRVVHDVLVVKSRPRRPSTLQPPGPSVGKQPPVLIRDRRPPAPFWAGTAIPSGYSVSHAVLMNNHRPPSASAFKRPFPGVTSIHIYPMTTTQSATTPVYPHGTIASLPISVYDTVANTTIVHSNIITLAKPTYGSSSSLDTTSSPPYMEEDEDYGTTTEAMPDSSETSPYPQSPTSPQRPPPPQRPATTEPLPDWALQHKPLTTTTSAPSSNLVAPIATMPNILGPLGNLVQKFPTGSLSMFQNIGRVMAVLPTMLAAFLLTALLFV